MSQDPRLHGPPRCLLSCSVCDGDHHWIEDSVVPEEDDFFDPEALHPVEKAVLAYDREHGTEHRLAFYGCKHCPAWAECDYVWDTQDGEDGE